MDTPRRSRRGLEARGWAKWTPRTAPRCGPEAWGWGPAPVREVDTPHRPRCGPEARGWGPAPVSVEGQGKSWTCCVRWSDVADPKAPKKKIQWSAAWAEARTLIWARRGRLALGLLLMLVSRVAGLALPISSKYLIDEVIGKQRLELLTTLAWVVGLATVVQAITSFGLSQILGVAAQKAITDMRRRVEEHVMRLPVRYFDSTQTGVLISRVMNDAEGIRNLVGTGLVQLVGSIVTAMFALAFLLYLNWQLTLATILVLAAFGGAMSYAFRTLRPLFRERGKITAEVTGRLNQALGGVRVVKTYTAERREDLVFTKGAHSLFRNIAKSMTGVSGTTAFSSVVIGAIGIVMMLVGGRSIVNGTMTLGDLFAYIFFTGLLAMPIVQIASIGTQITEAFAGLDRIHEILQTPREDADDANRHAARRPGRRYRVRPRVVRVQRRACRC